ncbi:hypothetical protein LJC61_06835 [Ruminococcaceae bacterium OttesenSCG-928-A16]|nr:hypothetical protein [Ruminococcaceae bacterium OttesenSCG-928-A16]
MIKNFFQALLKIAFIAGLVSAVLAVVYYFTDKQNDYIEIYNDTDDEDDFDDGEDFG